MFQRKHVLAIAVAGALSLGATAASATTVAYDFSTVAGQYTGQATPLTVNGATFSSVSDSASNALGLGQNGTYYAGNNGGIYSTLGSYVLSTAGYGTLVPDTTLNISFAQAQNAIAFNFALGSSSGGEQITITTNGGTTQTLTSFVTPSGDFYPQGLFQLSALPTFTSVSITATDSAGAQDLAIGNLTSNAVPLPGSLPLLLSGVVGVGAMLRRRKVAAAA